MRKSGRAGRDVKLRLRKTNMKRRTIDRAPDAGAMKRTRKKRKRHAGKGQGLIGGR
jgi:hypothetical protein